MVNKNKKRVLSFISKLCCGLIICSLSLFLLFSNKNIKAVEPGDMVVNYESAAIGDIYTEEYYLDGES